MVNYSIDVWFTLLISQMLKGKIQINTFQNGCMFAFIKTILFSLQNTQNKEQF